MEIILKMYSEWLFQELVSLMHVEGYNWVVFKELW